MKYYIDTEFHEYAKKPRFGKPINTIELISIGIVDEKDRKYYAICKDFDLKSAWRDEWLKENVLKSIHKELCAMVGTYGKTYYHGLFEPFTIKSMRNLLKWYGRSRHEIATEVIKFTGAKYIATNSPEKGIDKTIDFYAYYADYDWVVFCQQLFGRMIDLPKGFPMYCRDLKQMLDEKAISNIKSNQTIEDKLLIYKLKKDYPKKENEHNALADAEWNKELDNFINSL